MRFITEFIEPEYFNKNKRFPYVPEKRHIMEVSMGNMIAESFGWQNPVNHNLDHHRLEIEAFPMDKWMDFKRKLNDSYAGDGFNEILMLIKELESFGKPAGDTITNLSDQIEYRGPNSHCKACEDEAAGIKHIQAQKHTCRK